MVRTVPVNIYKNTRRRSSARWCRRKPHNPLEMGTTVSVLQSSQSGRQVLPGAKVSLLVTSMAVPPACTGGQSRCLNITPENKVEYRRRKVVPAQHRCLSANILESATRQCRRRFSSREYHHHRRFSTSSIALHQHKYEGDVLFSTHQPSSAQHGGHHPYSEGRHCSLLSSLAPSYLITFRSFTIGSHTKADRHHHAFAAPPIHIRASGSDSCCLIDVNVNAWSADRTQTQ